MPTFTYSRYNFDKLHCLFISVYYKCCKKACFLEKNIHHVFPEVFKRNYNTLQNAIFKGT